MSYMRLRVLDPRVNVLDPRLNVVDPKLRVLDPNVGHIGFGCSILSLFCEFPKVATTLHLPSSVICSSWILSFYWPWSEYFIMYSPVAAAV